MSLFKTFTKKHKEYKQLHDQMFGKDMFIEVDFEDPKFVKLNQLAIEVSELMRKLNMIK